MDKFDAAHIEVARLTHELDITNADHIALWLEANMDDSPLAWLACRIIEAHEAALHAREAAARTEGRREGIEEAAKVAEGVLGVNATAIRALHAGRFDQFNQRYVDALRSLMLPDPVDPDEELARAFHDAYETLAPEFGYSTRKDTRQFDPRSLNGKLMLATIKRLREQGRLTDAK